MRQFLLYTLLLSLSVPLSGQLSGNNLAEVQLGNLPGIDPGFPLSYYDQLNVKYRYKSLNASIRYEHFLSQNKGSSFFDMSQFQLQYRKQGLDLKIGHFSEILGNGLLLRAYEIPGSVYEDEGYRVRYGFYRDIQGFSGKYQNKHFYVKGLRGKVLTNELPPILERDLRRTDLVEAMESGISFYGQGAGLVLMRNSAADYKDWYYSILASGGLLSFFNYSFEFAHNLKDGLSLFETDDPEARYGLYSSLNFSYSRFGLSMEFKDLSRMLIGSGINDPPTLVKEHKYKVLNRSIHVPKFSDEKGIQVEAYYSFKDGSRLLVNHARAVNEFTVTTRYLFNEYFLEYSFYKGSSTITLFADYASDEFKRETNRYSGGGLWERALKNSWSSLFELEYQWIDREGLTPAKINNLVLIAGISHSPEFSVSVVAEISDDPRQVNDQPARIWLGTDIMYKFNHRHTVSLFVGQRRGGPACTSGVCYEVLDFEGVEVRFKSKF